MGRTTAASVGRGSSAVSSGFPVVSFKGKVWKIKARGEESLWLDDRGQPVPFVDAVIVNGSSHVSKQFYAKKFADELKKRFPTLPIYLVGTSRGTISAAFVGRDLGREVAGVVLTSTMFGSSNPRRQAPTLRGFDYGAIQSPLLFVHHREDGCEHTPYASAARVAPPHELISVSGGNRAESGPCEPLSAHGYFGREPQTVDAIAAWMLKRPFAKLIE